MIFKLENKDQFSNARAGTIYTDHGLIQTPVFMPVGTQGTVKTVTPRELTEMQMQVILCNTYHLYLRPGLDIILKAGGLHKFVSWDKAILTDSGGFQVYSLSDLTKISEEGVRFKSHIDGSYHQFTPENVISSQRIFGSDIIMVLDVCLESPADYEKAFEANELTIKWAERSKEKFINTGPLYSYSQSLFAIIQGGIYPEIRKISIIALIDKDFDGYAVGGLAVGETSEQMYEIVDICTELLPQDKARYLMGVGTPENILECIARGIDMFDCVLPTRNGRNSMLFTKFGTISIKNAEYKDSFIPIESDCECYTCKNFSRAYLRHLFNVNEILGLHLATLHNLHFYRWLISEARTNILINNYNIWMKNILDSINKPQY